MIFVNLLLNDAQTNIWSSVEIIAEAAGKTKASYRISLADALIIATAILAKYDYLVSQRYQENWLSLSKRTQRIGHERIN